jgi:RNA polymerase sigma factor (sigma-70 family)
MCQVYSYHSLATAVRNPDRLSQLSLPRASTIAATDGELLMRFVWQRDESAFAEIVERHGRLVWMICRQILRHHQDVEDAFQATFLILAERAQSIHASDSAAAWLYKVAMRTALAARSKRSTRREEPLAVEPADESAMPIIDDREMLYVLLQEVRLLPARYQTPLVMRYLEGQSRRAIAEQTDSTVGQVQGRLARGRRILRSRFLRRGVSLSLAAGAVASTAGAANAAVSPSVIESTAAACLTNRTSGSGNGITPAALALAKEGVQAMWFALATKCTAIVTAIALAGGIVLAAQNGRGGVSSTSAGKANIELKNAAASTSNQQSAAAESSAQPIPKTAYEKQREIVQKLAKRSESAWSELVSRMDEKAQKSAQLEIEQLEKAALQRKLEELQHQVANLDMRDVPVNGEERSKEDQKKRADILDKVVHELADTRNELLGKIKNTNQTAAEVERAQMMVAQKQREVDELSRARMQTELAAELSSAAASKTSTPKPEHSDKLQPTDAIRIKVARSYLTHLPPDSSNSLSTEPIADVFHIESNGTIALGPAYGRVKVAGLSIEEAEQAIKKHLAEIIQDPQVQVSEAPELTQSRIHPEQTSAANSFAAPQAMLGVAAEIPRALQSNAEKLQEMSAAIEELRAENTSLKKELQQLSTKPVGQTR